MPVTESFVSWMEQQVHEVSERTGLSRQHAFAVWALMFVHDELEESEALECCDTIDGAQGDGGIDGRYDDEDSEVFILTQAKLSDNPLESRINLGDALRDLPATVAAMLHAGPEGLPPKREAICEQLIEAIDKDRTLVLEYYLGGEVSTTTRTGIEQLSATVPGSEIAVYALEDLYSIYVDRELQQDLSDIEVVFPMGSPESIAIHLQPSGIESALCVALDAHGLGHAVKDLGSRLFSLNVRYELHKRNKYNLQMKETLNADPAAFWFYNNGITVVCDDWVLDSGDSSVRVTNPQVVNGCQTVSAITARRNSLAADVALVQARFIKKSMDTPGTEQAQKIAEYTNSQTHVKPADLRANERLQAEFQARFNLVDGNYFYERKRGEWDQLGTEVRRRITVARKVTMTNIGQRYVSWTGYPATAISDKGKMFDDKAYHKEVFRLDVDPQVYLLAHEVFGFFDSLLSNRRRPYLVQLGVLDAGEIRRLERAKKYFASHSTLLAKTILERRFGVIDSTTASTFRDYFSRSEVQKQLAKYVGNVFQQFLQAHPANQEDVKRLLANEATSTAELQRSLESTLHMLPLGVEILPPM